MVRIHSMDSIGKLVSYLIARQEKIRKRSMEEATIVCKRAHPAIFIDA